MVITLPLEMVVVVLLAVAVVVEMAVLVIVIVELVVVVVEIVVDMEQEVVDRPWVNRLESQEKVQYKPQKTEIRTYNQIAYVPLLDHSQSV